MDRECQFFKDSGGRRLCFAEYGDPSGEPLFYFHGWPSSRLQARLLEGPARIQGFRVIAPDRPGLGQSDPRPGRSLRDWPPTVGELADHLRIDRFFTMGVSGGGPYALACAHWLPSRTIAASVVCGAPPLREFPDKSELMFPYRLLLKLRPAAPLLFYPLLPFCRFVSNQQTDRAPLRWVLKWLSDVDREAVAADPENFRVLMASFHEAILQGGPSLVADADLYLDDWEINYESITVPIDFWHGACDHNLPLSMVKQIAARIPGAHTHWLSDEGHYSLPLNRSEEILQSLSTLRCSPGS